VSRLVQLPSEIYSLKAANIFHMFSLMAAALELQFVPTGMADDGRTP